MEVLEEEELKLMK